MSPLTVASGKPPMRELTALKIITGAALLISALCALWIAVQAVQRCPAPLKPSGALYAVPEAPGGSGGYFLTKGSNHG